MAVYYVYSIYLVEVWKNIEDLGYNLISETEFKLGSLKYEAEWYSLLSMTCSSLHIVHVL
jgi:hypothetical protein